MQAFCSCSECFSGLQVSGMGLLVTSKACHAPGSLLICLLFLSGKESEIS